MNTTQIKLNDIEGAKEFVAAANKCEFDIDVYFNKIALAAKSILGILSLDHRNTLTVKYDGNNENFSQVLLKYAAC